jgi:hypothetical protein
MKLPSLLLAVVFSVWSAGSLQAARPILCCDYGGGRVTILSATGEIQWQVEAKNPQDCWQLPNGNILFATREQIFLSTDKLKSHRPIRVKNRDGSDYRPHTPVDPNLPGWYFHSLDGEHTWDVNGREMLVWGNYCNVLGGSVPVNIYYSTDSGETVKLAYAFGQNPKFQQKGTKPSDPMLGDPANPLIARHIHNVTYHATENAFYAVTGDIDRGHGNEVHWLRGTYDAAADQWAWKTLISVNSNSRFKCGGLNFIDGQICWIADANGLAIANRYDRGIFQCAPQDLTDTTKHTLLYNPGYESANMLHHEGIYVATHCAPASPYGCGIIWSSDKGKTWAQYDLKELAPRSGCRINYPNTDGWLRMDLRKGWIERAEVLFLKPKK